MYLYVTHALTDNERITVSAISPVFVNQLGRSLRLSHLNSIRNPFPSRYMAQPKMSNLEQLVSSDQVESEVSCFYVFSQKLFMLILG